jgi:biotin carboxylase
VITGIPTTLPLLVDIAAEPVFTEGRYDTGYIIDRAEHLPTLRSAAAGPLAAARS